MTHVPQFVEEGFGFRRGDVVRCTAPFVEDRYRYALVVCIEPRSHFPVKVIHPNATWCGHDPERIVLVDPSDPIHASTTEACMGPGCTVVRAIWKLHLEEASRVHA